VELVAGALLLLGIRVRASALLVVLMMASFMIALGWALHLDLHMSCGCFGLQGAADQDPISGWTLRARRRSGWCSCVRARRRRAVRSGLESG